MPINGQFYQINNPALFFTQLLVGGGEPSAGFAPLTKQGFSVTVLGFNHATPTVHHVMTVNANAADSAFSFNDFPTSLNVDDVSFTVTNMGAPVYRSAVFPYAHAKEGVRKIFLLQPSSQSIPASFINNALSGAGASLPDNTNLSTTTWGFSVTGSQSGADINFGVKIVPHFSNNLSIFADLALNGWNIHVGFPADFCHNAHDIRLQIQSAIASSEGPVNVQIKNRIVDVFQSQLPSALSPADQKADATKLFDLTSVTFSAIEFKNHVWPLSNKNDNTPVMVVNPVIGFPRNW